MRDHALEVNGGTVQAAARINRGSKRIWVITVAPDGNGDVSIALPADRDCDAEGAICTLDGRKLHNRPEATVPGPDLSTQEDEGSPTEPPVAPTNLRASPNTDGSVTLSWDAPDDDSITGYQILRRHPGETEGTMVETLLDTGSTATAFTDNDLTLDVLHAYYVKAINAAGASERSNYDNATPHQAQDWEMGLYAPTVYLTFDDGPHPPYTGQILDLLEKYGARATFFVTGLNAALHPDIIRRMAAERHGIGNHTWQHESLVTLTRDEFNGTVTRTQDQIGEHAVPCLRPPYGKIDSRTTAWAASLGLDIVMWSIDSRDHTGPGVDRLVSSLSSTVTYFSNVLLHDGGQTVEALRILLERWARLGYQFKPVCELPTVEVRIPNIPAEGAPTITGTAQVGRTVTASTPAITDGDGLISASFSYQWLADNIEIADATNPSYMIAAEHEGKTIMARVGFNRRRRKHRVADEHSDSTGGRGGTSHRFC